MVTIYDKNGVAHEKTPIDAKECVNGLEFSYANDLQDKKFFPQDKKPKKFISGELNEKI